jgi:RND family efflux transporter MFP subunit
LEVRVVRPTHGTIHRFVTLPGTLRARQQATLYAKVPGYLKSIAVDRGDFVQAGQSLAEIEVPELEVDRAKFQTEVRVAGIESQRVAAARSKAPDLVTPQSVDEAQGRLDLARARLDHAETLLRYRHILAPFDGIVTTRHVDPGAFVPAATAGSAASTAATTLMDFRTIRVVVPVPESEASRVRVSQPVRVSVEGLPGRMFEGNVSRHGFALDEASRSLPSSRTFRIPSSNFGRGCTPGSVLASRAMPTPCSCRRRRW